MNERDAKLHYIFSVMLVSSFVLQCFSLNLLILLPVYEVYVGRVCGFLVTSVLSMTYSDALELHRL